MKEITTEIYDGCVEVQVYPFLDDSADWKARAFSGYVRVLYERNNPPRIDVNIQLGHVTVEEIRTFQEALTRIAQLAADTTYGERWVTGKK